MHWYYISDFSVGIFYNILNRMAILCILVLFLFLGSILPMLTGVYAAISQLSVYMSYWPLFSWSIFLIWKICWQKKVEFCFMSSCQWNHHIDVYLMIQHTYGFIFFELTLNPWKISNLITVNSPFDRLLKSVCQCSVEDRYAHQKLVSFFFLLAHETFPTMTVHFVIDLFLHVSRFCIICLPGSGCMFLVICWLLLDY